MGAETDADNMTKAKLDSSRESSPSLWLAVHDPSIELRQALELDMAQLHLINANSEVAINLGIHRRQKQGQDMFYDYQLAISSVPARDLPCDTSVAGYYPCFVSLFIQFPTFERQTMREKQVLEWTVC